jgi:hypothetical protein
MQALVNTFAEFQQALNCLRNASPQGGTIEIAAGTIDIPSTLKIPGGLALSIRGTGPASLLNATFQDGPVLELEKAEYFRERSVLFEDFSISRSIRSTASQGILVNGPGTKRISRIHVTQQGTGIMVPADNSNLQIVDCIFNNGVSVGVDIANANMWVEGCVFEVGTTAIECRCQSAWISKCLIVNGGGFEFGIFVHKSENSVYIDNCTFEGARKAFIFFDNDVNRSFIRECWFGITQDGAKGVWLKPECSKISISGSFFSNIAGQCILADRADFVTILNNHFSHIKDDKIVHLYGARDITVSSNQFSREARRVAISLEDHPSQNVARVLVVGNNFSVNENCIDDKRRVVTAIGNVP